MTSQLPSRRILMAFVVFLHVSSSMATTVPADLCLRTRRCDTRTLFVSSLFLRPNDSSKCGITSQSTEDAIRNRINTVRFSNIPQRRATDNLFIFSVRGGDDATIQGDYATHIDSSDTISSSKARGVSLSLFLTYLSVMCSKCALPTTLSILILPNSGLIHSNTGLTRQGMMSRLLALSTVAIAMGKLLLGPIIDALGGVLSLQIALSTLLICLGCIGFGPTTCPTLTTFACYWIVVDFAFSSCWAACVKTIRDTLPEMNWVKEVGRLAMAARIGNALGFAFFASLLQWTITGASAPSTAGVGSIEEEWRWVYRAAALIQLLPLLMLTHYGNGITNNAMSTYKREESVTTSRLDQSLTILRYQSLKPEFWLHLISRSLIMVLVSFLLFIPSFMAQCYGMTSSSSAQVGSLFALGCLLSVSTLSEKSFPSVGMITNETGPRESRLIQVNYRRKAYSMLAFLATSTMCLLIQTIFLRGTISLTPLIGSLLMFLFGFSLGKIKYSKKHLLLQFRLELMNHFIIVSNTILSSSNNLCIKKWWYSGFCNNC